MDVPVSLHVHGVDYEISSDGTRQNKSAVEPGGTRVYTWRTHKPGRREDGTWRAGSAYWHYHDHVVGTVHGTGGIRNGLYGPVVVRRKGDILPDATHTIVFNDMTINNKPPHSGPDFEATMGDRVEIVMITHGEYYHTFHMHGHRWADNRTGILTGPDDPTRVVDTKICGPAESFGFQVIAGRGGRGRVDVPLPCPEPLRHGHGRPVPGQETRRDHSRLRPARARTHCVLRGEVRARALTGAARTRRERSRRRAGRGYPFGQPPGEEPRSERECAASHAGGRGRAGRGLPGHRVPCGQRLRRSARTLAERVRRAVDELGYVPNQAARSLVTRRHDAVAVIVAEPETRVFADPFFARQLRGISKELTAHDNQLVLLLTEDRDDHARVARYLAGGHVDGALVFSLHIDDPLPGLIQRAGLPTVFGGTALERRRGRRPLRRHRQPGRRPRRRTPSPRPRPPPHRAHHRRPRPDLGGGPARRLPGRHGGPRPGARRGR